MPAISIRNIPPTLYDSLKGRAVANDRSLNKEVIVALTAHIAPVDTKSAASASERLAMMRALLAVAPRIDKRSSAYRTKEDDVLGYTQHGHCS